MDEPRPHEGPDEAAPLPLDEEREAPAFATVRLVDVQRSVGAQDTTWHPELKAGMKCPHGCGYTLKRHRSTVYCGFCRQRWWPQRPV